MRRIAIRLLLLCAATAAFPLETTGQRAQTRKPNIILIMADDLGYETIGANGGTSYQTPAIDRMAARRRRNSNGNSPRWSHIWTRWSGG
jgi:arylsulfatase A